MDNPELAHLNQIELDGPLDQPERGVMARDRVTGSILVLPREIVRALLRLKHGGASGRSDAETARRDRLGIASLLHTVQHLRQAGRAGQRAVNPLFLRISLFNVAPFQPYLTGLARAIVGPAYIWAMLALTFVALALGVQSEWAIAGAYQNIFSPQALLTFGIAAPLLKIFHELGHVLAATRYATRVAHAGILFIALFPIPFVDCSDADVSANRKQRVVISLAGLFTDMLLGVLIFIAWHFTTGDFLRALLGNLFVYLTLNSILFNANPLVKLDGYFALIDLVRYRNLSQDGGRSFKGFQLWLGSLGRLGQAPGNPGETAILVYAIASFFYRLYIVAFIAYSLLPRYMGVGAVLVVWGLIALFFAPLARSPEQAGPARSEDNKAIWTVRFGVLALIALSLVAIRVPVRQDLPVTVDASGHYAVSVPETGRLVALSEYGVMQAGARLAALESVALREQLVEREAELAIARRRLDAERGGEPVRAATARERVHSLSTQIAQLEYRIAQETLRAEVSGVFVPRSDLQSGTRLEAGSALGAYYPDSGNARLSGRFPERYVHYYRDGVQAAELRFGGEYYPLDVMQLTLQERVSIDRQSGQRLYVIQVTAPLPPAEIMSGAARLRLDFRTEALWQRAVFHVRGLLQNLQDARLSEIERRLG
jgi:hypothetical protein